jgi:ABC-type transport system substrate-binding protein
MTLAAALAVTLVLVVAACDNAVPSPVPTVSAPVPTASPTPEPPPEQTLTVALDGELSGGLSNAADGAHTPRAVAFLFDGLYGHDEHLQPIPVLAQDLATISEDGLTWTVRLRPGVTFHDGSALTADDVVQTYELARSTACRYNRTICLNDILATVVKVDQMTIAFTLVEKLASFASRYLGIWIESKDAVDASYERFLEGASAVTVAETTAFLANVAAEESSPTGPAGLDGTPTVDYSRFRTDGEALLDRAGIRRPNESTYTTDGVLDVGLYVRDIVTRVRAMDTSTTDRPIDALAAAYPYLDIQEDPVGTGPFRFVSYTPGEGLELASNEEYFRGAPTIKRLSFPIIGSDIDGGRALVSGEVDWKPSLQASTYDEIKDDPGLKFVEYLEFSFLGLFFNLHPEAGGLFLDKNLRQAVSYCFDKAATATAATGGHGEAIYSEIPPVSWAYPPTGLNTYPVDRTRAKELIETSGWELGSDGVYAKDGQRLATVVAVRAGFPQRSAWLASMGDQVRECGIDLTFREVGFAEILTMLDVYPHLNAAAPDDGRAFDAYFGGFVVSFDPDPFRLYHSSECSSAERPSTFNYICYQSAEADRLIDAGLAEFDQAKRAAIYHEYAVLLSEDLPVIYAWSDKVREGLRATVDTTDPGGLQLDTPTWYHEVEKLTNAQ